MTNMIKRIIKRSKSRDAVNTPDNVFEYTYTGRDPQGKSIDEILGSASTFTTTSIVKGTFKRSDTRNDKIDIILDVDFEYTGNECEVPKDVTHVRFHHSVIEVQEKAFQDCISLREVVLNEGLKKIGRKAFQKCKSLESITLPPTVTEIGTCAFSRCTQLRKVVLNGGLERVGRAAFNCCLSLQSITLPAALTEMGKNAFNSCRSLKEVVINEGLETIVYGAFANCISLVIITLPSTISEIEERAFDSCKMLKEIVLNEGLLMIGAESFDSCDSLKCIYLPATITEIEPHAFARCSNLKEVVLSNKGRLQQMKIGPWAFYHCKSLMSIDLSDTFLIEIPSDTFAYCTHLEVVILNESLKVIGSNTFAHCLSLQSINLPSTLTKIGEGAFSRCTALKDVVLNGGLKKIGAWAFCGCSSLMSITLPSTLDEISYYAFSSCTNLRVVELSEGLMEILDQGLTYYDSDPFVDCKSLERFTFPTISSRLTTIINASQSIKKKKKNTWWPQFIPLPNQTEVPLPKQTEVETRTDGIRGSLIERRGSELYVPASKLEGRNRWPRCRRQHHWKSIRRSLVKINCVISHYEMIEGTILFVLAFWKAKMDRADVVVAPTDRDAYRIDIPGPVKDTIMQYLFSKNEDDMNMDSEIE